PALPATPALSLHDALPISAVGSRPPARVMATFNFHGTIVDASGEPQSSRLVTVYRKTTLRDHDSRQPTATSGPAGQYAVDFTWRSEEHTSELQSREKLVCR